MKRVLVTISMGIMVVKGIQSRTTMKLARRNVFDSKLSPQFFLPTRDISDHLHELRHLSIHLVPYL